MNDTYDAHHASNNDQPADGGVPEPGRAVEARAHPSAQRQGFRLARLARWMPATPHAATDHHPAAATTGHWLARALLGARLACTRRAEALRPAVALWARTGAARAWQIARHASPADARGGVNRSYSRLRRWSPLAVPLALDIVLLTFAVLLARHVIGRIPVPWQHVGTLAGVLVVLSLLVAATLYAAPNDSVWTATLGLSIALYLTVAAAVLFGPLAGVVTATLLALAAGTFVRERLHPVMEHTVHVTTLFGRYHRTLLPGVNVLLPGERMLAILPTRPQEHTTVPLRAIGPDGHANQATATIHYELVPEEASRAVLVARDWERNLRRILAATLRDELANWDPAWRRTAPDHHAAGNVGTDQARRAGETNADSERLAARVEQRVRQQVLQWGVQVASVRLQDVVLPPPADARESPHSGRIPAPIIVEGSLVPPPAGTAPGRRSAPRLQTRTFDRLGQGSTLPLDASPVQPAQTMASSPQEPDAGALATSTTPHGPRLLARIAGFARGRERAARMPEPNAPAGNAADTPSSSDERVRGTGHADATSGAGTGTGPTPTNQATPTPAVPLPAPTVLASAYEAVREGRISDPATVRQIADAFAQLASATDPDADLDLDPTAAAHNLRQRAQELTLVRGYDVEQAPIPPQGAPRRTLPPRVERDENLTAGG
jgi:hypothetical protein